MIYSPYEVQIWNFLKTLCGNDYAVAGMMGNFYAESHLRPFIAEGDTNPPYTASQQYTARMDAGLISEATFVNSNTGYGLAQWTYSSRKQALYDLWIIQPDGTSIGDCSLQLAFVKNELEYLFPGVFTAMQNASDLTTITNTIMTQYEMPADQSAASLAARVSYATALYNEYQGTGGFPYWMLFKFKRGGMQ